MEYDALIRSRMDGPNGHPSWSRFSSNHRGRGVSPQRILRIFLKMLERFGDSGALDMERTMHVHRF